MLLTQAAGPALAGKSHDPRAAFILLGPPCVLTYQWFLAHVIQVRATLKALVSHYELVHQLFE
jgi:hypothetical protein